MRYLIKVTRSLSATGISYIKVEILKTKETEFQRELVAGLQTNILCIGKITSGHRGRHTLFLKQPSHKHLLWKLMLW